MFLRFDIEVLRFSLSVQLPQIVCLQVPGGGLEVLLGLIQPKTLCQAERENNANSPICTPLRSLERYAGRLS